ncbi:hypothetical protein [Marinomonas epiphytica]
MGMRKVSSHALEQLESVHATLKGCIDTLSQGQEFLEGITDQVYCYDARPFVDSTIGQHFRHLLDVFLSVRQEIGVVDYNTRRRGHEVEVNRLLAVQELQHAIDWLESCHDDAISIPVTVISEVSVSETQVCSMLSTLEREITFAALHANHHYAMAKVVVNLAGNHASQDHQGFGFAPSTLSYLKGQ